MPQFRRNYGQLHGHRDPDRYPANWRIRSRRGYDVDYVGEPRGRYGRGEGYGFDEYRPDAYGMRRASYGAGYGAMDRIRGYDVREGYRQSRSSIPGHRAGYGYDYDQYRWGR